MTEKTKCQCCGNSFEIDSEQAICVESFGECIFCRFSPNSKGSKSGTQAELSEIVVKQEVKRRLKRQQPETIDMDKFLGSGAPVALMSDEHRAMIQRGVERTTPPAGDIRALKHRIHELEGELLGYKKIVAGQDAMLERQTARIVGLQEHIENFDGEDR